MTTSDDARLATNLAGRKATAMNEVESDVQADAGMTVDGLALLPSGAILDEKALAVMFGCCTATIKRQVKNGSLPVPVRMFGRSCWTAGAILAHVEKRLAAAQQDAAKENRRLSALLP